MRSFFQQVPYLIVDARYERVREAGVIVSHAVLIAIGIDWTAAARSWGSNSPIGKAARAGATSCADSRRAGLTAWSWWSPTIMRGLRRRFARVLPEAVWQRCYVHFLRNALDYVPRKVDDDCLQELRWLYARRDLAEARSDLTAWLARWAGKYPRLTAWVEENLEETLSFYRLPTPAP